MPKMSKKSDNPVTYPVFEGPRPDFTDPPVSEVVLSLQFEPIQSLDIPHFGLIWERFRKSYPKTSTKTPLSSSIEEFGSSRSAPHLQFQVIQEPVTPRCWFENSDGTELIQVQQDRFIFNWKSGQNRAVYPRYEKVRSKFLKHLKIFEEYLRENNLGSIAPNQCEVTYVNELYPNKLWKRHGQLKNIFSLWSGGHSDKFLSEPEDVFFRIKQRMLSNEGAPLGRLHISVEPRVRIPDGAPMYRFVLTARGAPLKPTKKAVVDFFNFGREYVVRGFASVTTKPMHKVWERNDV